MADKEKWEEQLREFWKRAGSELKRTTDDLRVEAQRLVAQVSEPATQEKLRQGLRKFGDWTRKTVEDAAMMFEQAIDRAGDKVDGWKASQGTGPARTPTAPESASAAPGETTARTGGARAKPRSKPAAKSKARPAAKKPAPKRKAPKK